ncbi:MAG: hypothetical protein CL608_32705 [Anaerolineaceae bacterium]|nr:hypothetical protein [Anaerolineaceae bacterium]
MSNLSKTVDEKSEAVMQKAQNQMDEWREEINEMEKKVSELSGEAKAEFQEQLTKLKLHWQQLESKFSALMQANDDQREAAYADWRDTAVSYNNTFMSTTHEMKEYVPLGWLQGFTDRRTQDSEGWAEGFTERGPEDSEGWAEGMGHKGKVKSKGWAEGYDKVSKS